MLQINIRSFFGCRYRIALIIYPETFTTKITPASIYIIKIIIFG
ncbi:hypothetical protein HMPREF9538_01354 [Klebsiella sp. MS 92-3]|nr:hypothetical protein HMPREF9538_01354 [Klebsiella sp. MS 92-3]